MRAWVGGVAGVAALAVGICGGWLLVARPEQRVAAPTTNTAAVAPAPFGSLEGVVMWGGRRPARKPLATTRDHGPCGTEVPDLSIEVGPAGGLKNAVVSIDGLKPAKPYEAGAPIPLDQRGCLFTNRVTVVPRGATLMVMNGDTILHNTHFNAVRNKAENFAIPAGMKQPYRVQSSETVKITCDIHPWMAAYLIVRDNPYFAVTDVHGRFAIHDLPVGFHEVKVWQETVGKGGTAPVEIEIRAGETTWHEFALEPR